MEQKSHVKLLMYAGTLFLVVLSVLAIVGTIFLTKGSQRYDENTISVSGTAEVNSAPDIANFSFTVKETSKTNKEAQDVISEKVSTILDGLEELGIKEKDIKTQSYTIYPKYEYVRVEREQEVAVDGTIYFPGNDRQRVQTGFDVSQNVSLKLRDFDQVGTVLELLAETGVENLNGPNFDIEDPEALQEEAREEAIDDAKDKAKRLAKDLGVKLGDVVSFNENKGGWYPQPYARMELQAVSFDMEDSFAPELPTGENTISSNVTITYTIK
ncbi:MAG: SIMPL domain-containing protein [Candidatus Pacebacteria bacterium]|nr:SIMPL domain-containing protein [Candidatus Paceibacterota bacterium]